ncbi:MAG TPA: hypothetical protein VGE26_01185 [Sphingobacteriaceae bacterium]
MSLRCDRAAGSFYQIQKFELPDLEKIGLQIARQFGKLPGRNVLVELQQNILKHVFGVISNHAIVT